MESKESMKKRRGTSDRSGSPDEGDALALTFARPVAPRSTEQQMAAEAEEEDYWNSTSRGRVWG